jgi:hypothetical protein
MPSEKAAAHTSADCMVNHQEKHRPGYSHNNAVEIQVRYPCHAEHVENPAADNCADYTEKNVENDAFAVMIDQVTSDEPGH